jgi:ATP-dependent protease ClpP protease subunit
MTPKQAMQAIQAQKQEPPPPPYDPNSATVTIRDVVPGYNGYKRMFIEGQITNYTVYLAKQVFNSPEGLKGSWGDPGGSLSVGINSPGGSVDASMALGRLLREKETLIFVSDDGECASSCVFVLGGAEYRGLVNKNGELMGGDVGIHRPYLTDTTLTGQQVQRQIYEVERKIRSYFSEMHISQRLADDMMAIPPNKIRWLTPRELINYGLDGEDPVLRESHILFGATKKMPVGKKQDFRFTRRPIP